MRERAEWRAALALLAASAGLGLVSGRELVLFFGQTRGAAWAGVLAASALYGLLVGAALRQPPAVGRGGLEQTGETLRLLLAALASAFMLYRLGRVGELTLPMRHSYGFGIAFGLLAALALNRLPERAQAGLSLLIALSAGLFFAANAVDPRPAALRMSGAVEFALDGSYRAALMLAVPYAALNACAAMWRLRCMGSGPTLRPARLGLKSAALYAALLALALWALRRGGDAVMAQPMPWVVLSARWGLAGFWLCAGLQALCAAASLSAALGLLISRVRKGGASCALAVGMMALGVMLLCALSNSPTTA